MPTLPINGIDLNYEIAGHGPPLLLLHGLGSRSEDWGLQLPVFARHYQVIAPDLRGHGRTSKPPGPYSVAMMAADVVGFLQGLGIDSAHIVGLSMGGMIAFQIAVDQPQRVRSMVIVNSAPAMVARTIGEWARIQQRVGLARLFGPARTGKFLSRRLFPKAEQEVLRAQLIERWAMNDRGSYLAAMRAIVGWSVQDRIRDIRCPVLVLSGDRDYMPLDFKQAYTGLIPGARLVVIEDSGHATPIDQADVFNAHVLEFLRNVAT